MLILSLIIIVAIILIAISVLSALTYIIKQAKEENDTTSLPIFSPHQKNGLRVVVLIIFLGILGFIYGIFEHNGIIGTIGIISWMIASLIAAYTCSPLRLITDNHNLQSGEKGAYFLHLPLFAISRLVSLLIIMFISWIYALSAIHRRSSKK